MVADPESAEITRLLRRWRDGERDALGELIPHVYERLRRMAHARLRGEGPGHTLDTSALVHEAYVRLVDGSAIDLRDREHFFAVASTAMRRVLLDHAKARRALKRGGEAVRVPIDVAFLGDAATTAASEPEALIALDAALQRLEARHPRQAKAIELRFFMGVTLEEAAEIQGTSAPTVLRDLRFAQAWLARELA
jgi:RNA polymerase sigma factor (TIGR02999 family)